jgi:hypothetical protein
LFYFPEHTVLSLEFNEKQAIKTSDKKQAIKTSDKKQAIKTSDNIQKVREFLPLHLTSQFATSNYYILLSLIGNKNSQEIPLNFS